MAYVFGYNLTPYSERIIEFLMTYRGMTAKQLTALMHAPFSYNLSEEKSVYNYLRKLKKQGMVNAYKLQSNVANGSIYYLTEKGYEHAKDMLNIEEGKIGAGWIKHYMGFEESNLGDLPYSLYTPPLKQPSHHLMLIDFFIQLNKIDEDFYDSINHRINLYAAKSYFVNNQKYRYRPDAEIVIENRLYAIEIDRATESHEQLLQKFDTYKQYLDSCLESKDPTGKLDGIIFVLENKRRDHGIKRRWTNLLSAFLKSMQTYQNDVNLIMTTLDTVGETLQFELKRSSFEDEARKKAENHLKKNGFSEVIGWHHHKTKTKQSSFSHAINNKGYKVFFNAISQQYESFLYTRYMNFLYNSLPFSHKAKQVEGLEFNGYESIVFYDKQQPHIIDDLSYYNVDPQIIKQLKELRENVYFRSFNEYLNFSLFE